MTIHIEKPVAPIKRLGKLMGGVSDAVKKADAAYRKPIEQNETRADRAVTIKEMLFDDVLDVLVAAWDGPKCDLVDYVQMKAGIKTVLMGYLASDGQGKYTIEPAGWDPIDLV